MKNIIKKQKIIIIFLFAIIICIIIFKIIYQKNMRYLIIGDNISMGFTPFSTYNKSYKDYFINYLNNNYDLKEYIDLSSKDITIEAFLKNINENIVVKDKHIMWWISNANLITIFLGMEEINNIEKQDITEKEKHQKLEKILDNYKTILHKIKDATDSKILIISLYSQEESFYINYFNNKLQNFQTKNIKYVSIKNIKGKKYYLPKSNNYYPSLEGHNYISNKLISALGSK